jgi:hypothetical protein
MHKAEPRVESSQFATAPEHAPQVEFPSQNQYDSAAQRRLTRPQGALRYDGHNKGKEAKNREVAEPYSEAPGLTAG